MPKRTAAERTLVEQLVKKGQSNNMINHQTGVPISTIALWRSQLATNTTQSLEVASVNHEALIAGERPTKIDRNYIKKLADHLSLINFEEGIPPYSVNWTVNNIFIRGFNSFFSQELETLQADVERSIAISLGYILSQSKNRAESPIVVHFVGDHFNMGSFFKNKKDDVSQFRIFNVVVQGMHSLFKRIQDHGYKNVSFIVHGRDFRSLVLDYALKSFVQPTAALTTNNIAVLSGLKIKEAEDAAIKAELQAKLTLYTDLTSISLGPTEFSFGNLTLDKGICSIKCTNMMFETDLTAFNLVHFTRSSK